MSILVLKLQGKGTGSADYVSVHTFNTYEDAGEFVKNNNTSGKCWTTSSIIDSGDEYETYSDSI